MSDQLKRGTETIAFARMASLRFWGWARLALRVAGKARGLWELPRLALRAPTLALQPRDDGGVPWQACIDTHSPRVAHMEVEATHVGLGLSPAVFAIVARRCAPAPRVPCTAWA